MRLVSLQLLGVNARLVLISWELARRLRLSSLGGLRTGLAHFLAVHRTLHPGRLESSLQRRWRHTVHQAGRLAGAALDIVVACNSSQRGALGHPFAGGLLVDRKLIPE